MSRDLTETYIKRNEEKTAEYVKLTCRNKVKVLRLRRNVIGHVEERQNTL